MTNHWLDTLMERTIVPSFSRIGIRVRRRLFQWPTLDQYSLKGKVVVLTGATSGIGEAAAKRYAHLGATLVLVGRDQSKTDALATALANSSGNPDITTVIADLGVRQDVIELADTLLQQCPRIDVLVHNAGALFNQRRRAGNGLDLTVELMVVTPFLLTGRLLPSLQAAAPARVLTMSSGGMYTEPLTVESLEMAEEHYQGAKQYARAKRAQVILNELWANKLDAEKVVCHSLHPGWVYTPGIADALPGFSRVLKPLGLLRTADEGADTLVWLSSADTAGGVTGGFWHDRAIRKIDMTQQSKTADTPERRAALWDWCEAQSGWQWSRS